MYSLSDSVPELPHTVDVRCQLSLALLYLNKDITMLLPAMSRLRSALWVQLQIYLEIMPKLLAFGTPGARACLRGISLPLSFVLVKLSLMLLYVQA